MRRILNHTFVEFQRKHSYFPLIGEANESGRGEEAEILNERNVLGFRFHLLAIEMFIYCALLKNRHCNRIYDIIKALQSIHKTKFAFYKCFSTTAGFRSEELTIKTVASIVTQTNTLFLCISGSICESNEAPTESGSLRSCSNCHECVSRKVIIAPKPCPLKWKITYFS